MLVGIFVFQNRAVLNFCRLVFYNKCKVMSIKKAVYLQFSKTFKRILKVLSVESIESLSFTV